MRRYSHILVVLAAATLAFLVYTLSCFWTQEKQKRVFSVNINGPIERAQISPTMIAVKKGEVVQLIPSGDVIYQNHIGGKGVLPLTALAKVHIFGLGTFRLNPNEPTVFKAPEDGFMELSVGIEHLPQTEFATVVKDGNGWRKAPAVIELRTLEKYSGKNNLCRLEPPGEWLVARLKSSVNAGGVLPNWHEIGNAVESVHDKAREHVLKEKLPTISSAEQREEVRRGPLSTITEYFFDLRDQRDHYMIPKRLRDDKGGEE